MGEAHRLRACVDGCRLPVVLARPILRIRVVSQETQAGLLLGNHLRDSQTFFLSSFAHSYLFCVLFHFYLWFRYAVFLEDCGHTV